MVRNNELEPTGAISKRIAKNVRAMIEDKGLSQEEVGQVVGRSQSYTSLRIKGLKSWTVDELDKLAPKLGYKNAIDLMRTAGTDGTSPRHLSEAEKDALAVRMAQHPDQYELAADDLPEQEKTANRLGDAYEQDEDDGDI